MKSDEQVLQELEQATAGLLFMSESDYPFQLIHWKGITEVTPQYLRGRTGHAADALVEVRSLDDFFQVAASEPEWKGPAEIETARRYQALVRLLKENLNDVKVYRVGEISIQVYVIGRSSTGNWMGISTQIVET